MIETTILYLEGWTAIVLVLLWTLTFGWAAYCTAKLFTASRLITRLKRTIRSYRMALDYFGAKENNNNNEEEE